MSDITFKRVSGRYLSSNGWTVYMYNHYTGLWYAERTGELTRFPYSPSNSFQSCKQAKEWVRSQ